MYQLIVKYYYHDLYFYIICMNLSYIFCIFTEIAMEFTFPAIMEVIVTPITVLIGIIGNILCIVVLNKKEVQLRKSFSRILIALSIFDITFISSTAVLFSMRYVICKLYFIFISVVELGKFYILLLHI